MRGRGGIVGGIVVLVVIAVAIVWLSGGASAPAFALDSSEPDGYRALALLLGDAGVPVRTATAAEVAAAPPGEGEALVVPVAEYSSARQRAAYDAAAGAGATVVLSGTDGFFPIDPHELARTPAQPVPRGFCDIAELDGLREIDGVDGVRLFPEAGAEQCFGDGRGAAVTRTSRGGGTVIELSTPYLWANARLQPNKEQGGQPLDNGPMGIALLGDASVVTFVDAVPTAGVTPEGTQSPLALMPLGVKLALAEAVGAFVLYAWWRARRLGRPVREELPVEVSGSELVEAVGGLLRRGGSPARAAEVLRADLRRTLGARLGLPPDARPDALVSLVAARTGREPAEVHAALVAGPVGSADDLVRLARMLDSIRTEVLDGTVRPRQPVG